jgi:hypothetical protein
MKLSAYGYMHLCIQCTDCHGASCYHPADAFVRGLCLIRNKRSELVPDKLTYLGGDYIMLSSGFNRSASHNEVNYVDNQERMG